MKIGDLYAFCEMPDAGLFFVVIEPTKKDIGVITLPNLQNDIINKDDMDILINSGDVELVDCLPKEVLAVCRKEYYNNDKLYKGTPNEFISRCK